MKAPVKRALPFAFALLLSFTVPATGFAQGQEHAASAEALDEMVVEHAATEEAERAELRSFLERPEVKEIADEAGIDVRTAENAVASLSSEEVADLSGELAAAQTGLAGGDTVVISTTAIIIGLLVLILILAAD